MVTTRPSIVKLVCSLFLLYACGKDEGLTQGWICSTAKDSGLIIYMYGDTVYLNSFQIQSACDTQVRVIGILPYVEEPNGLITFQTYANATGVINPERDSIYFVNKTNEAEGYSLDRLKVPNVSPFHLIDKESTLSSFFSQQISLQEEIIQRLDSPNEFGEEAKYCLDKIKETKSRLIRESLGVEYKTDLCWGQLEGLSVVILKPPLIGGGNLNLLLMHESRDCFQGFTRRYSYETSLSSRFFNQKNQMTNLSATTGELIMFYNSLIIEIHRLEKERIDSPKSD